MKNKLFIVIIIVVIAVGIYFIVKESLSPPIMSGEEWSISDPEPAPTGEEKTNQWHASSEMRELTEEEYLNHVRTSHEKTFVEYTDKGFIPSLVEIQKGQTVQFVNKSDGGMWIGSGPHPTHSEYPEFDAKKSVPSGRTYEFTFNKIGSWSYHNHIGSEKTGMVIVK